MSFKYVWRGFMLCVTIALGGCAADKSCLLTVVQDNDPDTKKTICIDTPLEVCEVPPGVLPAGYSSDLSQEIEGRGMCPPTHDDKAQVGSCVVGALGLETVIYYYDKDLYASVAVAAQQTSQGLASIRCVPLGS